MTIYLGYSRVSTEQQSLAMQLAALEPICSRIWQEKRTGTTMAGRTELAGLITEAKRLRAAGSPVTICVYSLSRLGRNLVQTVGLLEELRAAQIDFRSMTESIDTSTPMGRAFLGIVAALAQAEAEQLSERTKAGLAARKAQGIKLGPPVKDLGVQVEQAKVLIQAGCSLRKAAKQVGISQASLSRRLRAA